MKSQIPETCLALLLAGALAVPTLARADYFSLYLKCAGSVAAGKKHTRANLDLALRDNDYSAHVQKSNVLPVGEKMQYEVSPSTYSMSYAAPGANSRFYYDWYHGYLFAWYPDLKRLARVRLSIDRQSGKLAGELLNRDDRALARISMNCDAVDPEDLPPAKF